MYGYRILVDATIVETLLKRSFASELTAMTEREEGSPRRAWEHSHTPILLSDNSRELSFSVELWSCWLINTLLSLLVLQ